MNRIIYTAHAQRRMRQRQVTRRMIEQTLSAPDYPYRPGNVADEEIAERRFGNRIVQVVFEERKTGEVIVITRPKFIEHHEDQGGWSVRIQYDQAADSLYVALKPRTKVDNTLDAGPGVNIDVDAKGNPVGIEVLYAVRRLGRDALLTLGVDLSGLQWSPVPDRLLSTEEAAGALGVSRQYITRLAREGKLTATRAGRDWLIHESGLARLRRKERHIPP